jgi:hypothetical protein
MVGVNRTIHNLCNPSPLDWSAKKIVLTSHNEYICVLQYSAAISFCHYVHIPTEPEHVEAAL